MLLVLGMVAAMVMLSSPGPIFFSHRRIRSHGAFLLDVEVPDDVCELGRGAGGVPGANIRRRARSGTKTHKLKQIRGLRRSGFFCGDTAWMSCRSSGMC